MQMAVDCTILASINVIAIAKKHGMKDTINAIKKLLDYAANHLMPKFLKNPSEMILYIHSDASYISEPKAKIRFGGCFFLSLTETEPMLNGAIYVIRNLTKNVVASVAEAEIGREFENRREGLPLR